MCYMNRKSGFVYILFNRKNGTLYVGVTANLLSRIFQHNLKTIDGFTKRYEIDKLGYYKYYPTIQEAIAEEKRIKGGSRQKKVELIMLMNPNWEDLFIDLNNELNKIHSHEIDCFVEKTSSRNDDQRLNYAVFASGGGSNLQALIDAQGSVIHDAKIALVLSTKADAYSLIRAENAEIPTAVVPRSEQMEAESSALLESCNIDFIVLAGWMTVFSADFVSRWDKRIINTHPSLLPAFGGVGMYGIRVHEAVLAAGAKETGATVHYVNEVVDGGDIILQKSVAVEEGDTAESLQKRVLEQCEWVILPRAVQMVAEKLTREKPC